MATVVFETLQELKIKRKLLAVISDSVSNNDTLALQLYNKLKEHYDDCINPDFDFEI